MGEGGQAAGRRRPARPSFDPDSFLTKEVFSEAHSHLRDQVMLADTELSRRITDLERDAEERRRRQWSLVLAALTGLALPLILAAVLALLALRAG